MIFIKKQSYIMLFALLALLNNLSISMAKDKDKEIHNTEVNNAAQDSVFKFPDVTLYAEQNLVDICCNYIIDNDIITNPDLINVNMQDRLDKIRQIKNTRIPKILKYVFLNIIDDCSVDLISKTLAFIDKINGHFKKQEADLILVGCLNYGEFSFEANPWVYMITGFIKFMSFDLELLPTVNNYKWFIKDEIEELKRFCLTLLDSARDEDAILGHELNSVLKCLKEQFSQDFINKIINKGNEYSFGYKVAQIYEMISKNNFGPQLLIKLKETAANPGILNVLLTLFNNNDELIKRFEIRQLESILKYHENILKYNKNNFIYINRYMKIIQLYFLIGKDSRANLILNSIMDAMESSDNDGLFMFYSKLIKSVFYNKLCQSDRIFISRQFLLGLRLSKFITRKLNLSYNY